MQSVYRNQTEKKNNLRERARRYEKVNETELVRQRNGERERKRQGNEIANVGNGCINSGVAYVSYKYVIYY